jgi:putative transposase
VRYFNQRQARSGTLWEGRYRSTLIQAERYLLACMVYIDLNPSAPGWLRARRTIHGRAIGRTSAARRTGS